MNKSIIKKKTLPIGEEKDLENNGEAIAKLRAAIDYIAACDYEELFEGEVSE